MVVKASYVFNSNNWGKNIFDSGGTLRQILIDSDICNWDELEQGRENGIVIPIQIRKGESEQIGQMSIYRSKTRGDRRFGISNIKELGEIDDEMDIFYDYEENKLICQIIEKYSFEKNHSNKSEKYVVGIDQYPLPGPTEGDEESQTNNPKLVLNQETIGSLLDGTSIYVMPMFQRRFKWEKPQFDTLWSDIDDIWFGREQSQFLGAILINISKTGPGSVTQENWVIDGQQRITTLYALICAITKVAQDNGFEDLASNFKDPLVVTKGTKKGSPTIIPTLSDTKQFNDILKTLKPTMGDISLRDDKGINKRLYNAWKNDIVKGVLNRVVDSKGNIVGDKLEYLFEIVHDRLFFTMIVLPTAINPYMIFERLNNSGKKLSAADLVRNLIFENLIELPEAAEELYTGSMMEYEQSFSYNINNNVKSKLDDYYFPFTLTRDIENVTKAQMYNQLRNYWKQKKATSAAMIEELRQMAPVYIALCSEFPEKEILPRSETGEKDPVRKSSGIWKSLVRLRRYQPPTTTFPYLMELLQYYRESENDESEVIRCLDVLESYLIRRNISSLQNAGFTNFFRGIWSACEGKPDSEALLRKLKNTSGYEFPDDEMIKRELTTANLYSKKSLARFILNEYEISGEGEGHVNDYVLKNYQKSTIEHIIPREYHNWRPRMETWEDYSMDYLPAEGVESDYEKWHTKFHNTLGNLTILMPYENSEASNYDWNTDFGMTESPEKCKQYYYSKKAKFRKINQTAEKYAQGYDHNSHRERSMEIINWIIQRWKYF